MKVLQIHHRYSDKTPSGEDLVVDAEAAALRETGHELLALSRRWDDYAGRGALGLIDAALRCVWNPGAVAEVRAAGEAWVPDVVHVHNTFPSFSPAVLWPAHRRAPTVFTVHNYRAFCAAAVVSRDGRPCFECLERRSVLPALRYGCYRGSRVSTLAPAAMIATHRALGTWTGKVDAFIALSAYQRDTLIRAGWPEARIHVKPNFVGDPGPPLPWEEREPRVVFAGRLSPEKGCAVLIEAWHGWGADAPALDILGSGPQEEELRRLAQDGPAAPRITFRGRLSPQQVAAHLSRSRLVVVPSLWAEGFPLVIAEAFAAGTPVAVSDGGALVELVPGGRAGVHFRLGDASALRAAVEGVWRQPRLAALGEGARRHYLEHLSPGAVIASLLRIYDAAILHHASQVSRPG